MLILQILLMLVPALISVLLFERLKGCELPILKRVELLVVFAFFTNMIAYATVWIRGWAYINWELNCESTMLSVSFVLKYMAVSLVSAVALAFILCLVRVKKRNDQAGND